MKSGIGFTGMLGLMFIAFKLLGIINWSWLWVLAPLWALPALLVLIVGAPIAFAFVMLAVLKVSSMFQKR